MPPSPSLADRLRDLCAEYAKQGTGVPERWYTELADLRAQAVAASDFGLIQAIDALPTSHFKSPYWVL
jgi:hypothetical protein